jgi:hypothetical protein
MELETPEVIEFAKRKKAAEWPLET